MSTLIQHNKRLEAQRIKRAHKYKALRDSGLSVSAIAKRKGVTTQRVYYLLNSIK